MDIENDASSAANVIAKKAGPLPKVGDAGQPSIADWRMEIARDLQLALGKLKQLPVQEQTQLGRLIHALEVYLVT